MSTPKKLSELPLASDIAENDTVMVVDDTGNNVRVPWKNLCSALKLSVRNLIKSTFYSKTEPGAKFTKGYVCAHDDTIRFQLPNKISEQGPYAISFWAKSPNGPKVISVDINDCNTQPMKYLNVEAEWHFYSFVVNVSQNIGTEGFIDVDRASGVVLSDICLVKGNVPLLDWVPAPEDFLSGGG